jgi:hypothetical protein
MNEDEYHLRLLSVCHYVFAGITALVACFPIIHLVMGIVLLTTPELFRSGCGGPPPPPEMITIMGLMFTAVAMVLILIGWVFAVCVLLAGRCLARHDHHTFCMVIAAVNCLFVPLGTILGVFTIIVLARPSVKALFEGNVPGPFAP